MFCKYFSQFVLWFCYGILFSLVSFYLFILREREKERTRAGEGQRGRGRDRERKRIPSRLRAASSESDGGGSNPQTIRSWPELSSRVRRLTEPSGTHILLRDSWCAQNFKSLFHQIYQSVVASGVSVLLRRAFPFEIINSSSNISFLFIFLTFKLLPYLSFILALGVRKRSKFCFVLFCFPYDLAKLSQSLLLKISS